MPKKTDALQHSNGGHSKESHSGKEVTNLHNLSSRAEYRQILRRVVEIVRAELHIPGVSPFSPEELSAWFHDITTEDIACVWTDISAGEKKG